MIRKNGLFWLAIFFLLIFAALLRFWGLGQNPPSFDWDETAHGFNAYSILKTGRDEYGLKFPIYFRSFDDYKPPLYTYLVVPSVAVFGLNDFAVRAPSAFLGTLAVLATYLFVLELFGKRSIALLAAFFLAVSPWHLQFSRVAFETNSAVTFSILGAWAFLVGVKRNPKFLSLAAFAFGLNLWMYHNSRVFVPLLSLSLIFLFFKKVLKLRKFLILPILIALFFLTPMLYLFKTNPIVLLRFHGTSIFSQPEYLNYSASTIEQDRALGQQWLGRILHNRRLTYGQAIVQNYFSHFRPDFLFFSADMARHHAPQVGLLYLWDIPFIILGAYFLFRKNFDPRSKAIVFFWILFSPVAASVTWGVPHALRTEMFLPSYQILSALGLWGLNSVLKDRGILLRRSIMSFAILAFFLNFIFYLHQYWVHMPREFSKDWLYGRREAALFSDSIKDNYQKIIVSNSIDQGHMFFLYFLKYDPQKYLSEGGTVSGGFLEERNKFDKYQFRKINNLDLQEKRTLLIGVPKEFPKDAKVLKIIYYLNGEEAVKIVET